MAMFKTLFAAVGAASIASAVPLETLLRALMFQFVRHCRVKRALTRIGTFCNHYARGEERLMSDHQTGIGERTFTIQWLAVHELVVPTISFLGLISTMQSSNDEPNLNYRATVFVFI